MRPARLSACLAALVVATAACRAATPTPSPVRPTSSPTQAPTQAPTGTPIAAPSDSPTQLPTPSPVPPTPSMPVPCGGSGPGSQPLIGSVVGVTTACTAQLPPTPSPAPTETTPATPGRTAGAIDHPTAADAVILRVEQQGGFMMPGAVFARLPGFNLYGDGTVVYRPLDTQGTFGDAVPPLQVAHMDEDHVQALLRFVLGAGRLANAKPLYPNMAGGGDIPSTVFTLAAGDFSKKVVIQALGVNNPQVSADDARDRAAFLVLRDFLEDFGKQVAAGQADAVGPYAPTTYLGEMFPTGAPPDAASKPWPWPEITQQQLIVGPNDNQTFLVDLTPDQVAKLSPVPTGGLVAVQIVGPDKKGYSMSIRPLLPDDKPGQMPAAAG